MMFKVWEAAGQAQLLSDAIDEIEARNAGSDAEVLEHLRKHLEEADAAVGHRLEAVVAVMRNNEIEAEALRREADRLAERAKTAADRAARIKEALKQWMVATGAAKCAAGPFRVTLVQNAAQPVRVTDPDSLPEQFWRVKREPNLTAVGAAFAEGEAVPGAELLPRGWHVRIR